MNSTLSIVLIAGNEAKNIKDAISTIKWADEVILVAANSIDNTVKIAKQQLKNIKIYRTTDQYGKNFSKWRNIGLKQATSDWVFYLDADERINSNLKKEVKTIISTQTDHTHYAIPRANHFLGKRVHFGGTYPDYVIRLYQRQNIKKWVGKLHETAQVNGSLGYFKSDLLHYTHTDLSSMLQKSIIWTDTEADALYKSNHPPVVWWRFIRMILTKLYQRLIKQKMYKDGVVGWISAIFESYNTFIIYARLWEKQQNKN
jgi:glycosyltransferase involved in cell wall biosynthesis